MEPGSVEGIWTRYSSSDASTRFNSHVPEWREFLSNVVAMLSLYCFIVMLMLLSLVLIESDIDAYY